MNTLDPAVLVRKQAFAAGDVTHVPIEEQANSADCRMGTICDSDLSEVNPMTSQQRLMKAYVTWRAHE